VHIYTTNPATGIRHVRKTPCPDVLSTLAIVVMHVWKKRMMHHVCSVADNVVQARPLEGVKSLYTSPVAHHAQENPVASQR
jgi:hypothetical protein